MTMTTKMMMKNRGNRREEYNVYTIFYVFIQNRMTAGRDTAGAERYVFFQFPTVLYNNSNNNNK